MLVPTVERKLLAKWQVPSKVIGRVGEVNYKVYQPSKRKTEQKYYINLLKPWKDRPALTVRSLPLSQGSQTGGPLAVEELQFP